MPQKPRAQQGQPKEEAGPETAERREAQTEQIIQTGSITKTNGRYVIHCLTIVGQIEGHFILPPQNKSTKYEHVIPQLVAIEQDTEIEGLLILLNTVGGDVEAGLALAELIAGMSKPTVSLVLGGGHSIGVPLACSAKTSFIAPSATMTVHPVRMNGLVLGVPQTLSYFDKMQERITNFVVANSRIAPGRFHELMMTTGELITDVGTVLDGEAAVKEGLIDHLGGLAEAVECLYEQIEKSRGESSGKGRGKGGRARRNTAERDGDDRAAPEKKSAKGGRPQKAAKPPETAAPEKAKGRRGRRAAPDRAAAAEKGAPS